MAKKKEQNNGLRMILFYLTCGVVVVVTSFGGVFFTFGHLKAGIEKGDASELSEAVNFRALEDAIWTQLPENLAPVKLDQHSKYANSADVVSPAPRVKVNAKTFAGLVKKSGICAPAGAASGFDLDACTMTRESVSYASIKYKIVNHANKQLWAEFYIAKDGSLLVWHLTSATLSKAMLARVLN